MPTRLSQLFVRTLREDPADAEVTSHRLLVRAGYIRRQAPGIFAWLPLGLRVRAKVERVIREEMNAAGAQEVLFPGLLPREPYEATGRWEEYGDGIFRLQDRKGADYLLAPTHEEVFTLLVKDLYSSYKDLPLSIYQIQDKYRDEARPRAGLLRGREFSMKDAYSFDYTDAGLDVSYQAQRDAYERIFTRLGLEYVIVQADAGAMGGSRSEEFLHPTPIGEDTFVRSAGGYAANVEAFTTVVPDAAPVDIATLPPAKVLDSPEHPHHPDPRRPRQLGVSAPGPAQWTAADTLKNVVLALTHLDGTREVVVVGLPGDREVDLKRAEVQFAPAEVEPANESDFEKNPLLVHGYIGPWSALGPVLGEESATGIRYLLDPRVTDGTEWITGANEDQKHVFGLVAGRDFGVGRRCGGRGGSRGRPRPRRLGPRAPRARHGDRARVPARAQVRRGARPAGARRERQARHGHDGLVRHRRHPDPRGDRRALLRRQGPHLAARGRAVRRARDRDGQGRGRVHARRDGRRPSSRPRGFDVLYDDRPKVSPGVKFGDAELLGVPTIVIVGRGAADGVVELWDRASGARTELPAADLLAALNAQ